jgi:uncharacterized membrane protein YkvA (DUF1232 family)
MWIDVLIGIGAGLLAGWLLLAIALVLAKPDKQTVVEAARLLPDVVRLVGRLARDRSLPRGVRVAPWLLMVYLVLPIDIIPDFFPIIGYADDAILTLLVLRWIIRHAGPDALTRNWPGTNDGLRALAGLVGIGPLPDVANDDKIEDVAR